MEAPPFKITSKILQLVADIQVVLGQLDAQSIQIKPSPKLRKENKIRTVKHSLAIEGNTLNEEQVTALVEKKRVIGPATQIREVVNAIELYDQMAKLKSASEKDFLQAHKLLMSGLVEKPGQYRSTAVGIFKGTQISRMAPPAKQIPLLMGKLFEFLKKDKQAHPLIKACVFHYELEFIHPFIDGNGRMGRFWQQRLLMEHSPVFEFIAVESWIHREQKKYYLALEKSDHEGESTHFIEFSLELILKELNLFRADYRPIKDDYSVRIESALLHFSNREFSRKDYQSLHKNISAPTASRDLAQGVRDGKIQIQGTKARAVYRVKA